MYKYRSRPRKTRLKRLASALPLIVVGATATAFVYWYPLQTANRSESRVFEQGVTITLDRSSPVFAAMEDSLFGPRLAVGGGEGGMFGTSASRQPLVVTYLQAGAESAESVAENIVRENRREENLMAQARAAREAQAKALAQATLQAFQKLVEHYAKKEPAAKTQPSRTIASADKSSKATPVVHPTKTLSLTDLKMNRDELVSGLLFPIAAATQEIETSEGTVILASGGRPASGVGIGAGARIGGLVPSNRSAWNSSSGAAQSKMLSPVRSGVQTYQVASDISRQPTNQLVIAGPIEFQGGLALTNSADRVVVFRESDGELLEAGAVWLREARYEIFVNETDGHLIAELQTPHGGVLGQGEFDLDRLPPVSSSQYRVDRIPLRIKPLPQGLIGRVLSAPTRESKPSPLAGAQIDLRNLPLGALSTKDGHFEETNIMEGSSVLMRTAALKHWPTLSFATTGSENELILLPEKHLKTVAKVAMPQGIDVPRTAGIVWGQVTSGGHPIAGAQVDLMTTPDSLQPVYFNATFVPDPALKATSANGLYAFFPVNPGSHAVQAIVNEKQQSEPVLFPAEDKTLSAVQIEVAKTRKAKVKVFDAFRTMQPLAAEITTPGAKSGINIDQTGAGSLPYAAGSGLMLFDIDAGPLYQKARMALARDRRSIFIPMIQTAWLERVRSALKSNAEANAGVVVAFIQGNLPYKVAVEEKSLLPSSQIVYFNSKGEVTGKDFGEPGGGFVIFNMPEGFRTLSIQASGSPKVFAPTVLVENEVLSVISHWMR